MKRLALNLLWFVLLTSPPICRASQSLAAEPQPNDAAPSAGDDFLEGWLRGDDLGTLDLDALLQPAFEIIWDRSVSLSAGAGYRDNVFLAPSGEEGGAFLLGGFDASLIRLGSLDSLSLLVSSQHLEFESGLPNDTFVALVVRYDRSPSALYAISVPLQVYYLDQVLEVEMTDGERERLRLRAIGAGFRPVLRLLRRDNLSLETGPIVSRHLPRDKNVSAFWETGAGVKISWEPGQTKFTAGFDYTYRSDDDRRAFRDDASVINNKKARQHQYAWEFGIRQVWGESGHWSSSTVAGIDLVRDAISNYYSYDRFSLRQGIAWDNKLWLVEATARFSQYRYDVQRVEQEGSRRRRENAGLTFEVRRALGEQIEVFLTYSRDFVESRDAPEEYSVDTWTVGLGWQL